MAWGSSQKEWQQKTLTYVKEVNTFVARGIRDDWENTGKEPQDRGRAKLASAALSAVRKANATGEFENLRKFWPPAHAPFVNQLDENGQSIPVVALLGDGSIVARIGTNYEEGKTVRINGDTVTEVPDSGYFGMSPNRRYFGIARKEGVEILEGWDGPRVTLCPWPTGLEDIPEGFSVKPWDGPLSPSRIIPFPDGQRVLVADENGIFVMSPDGARRILPTEEDMRKHFESSQKEYPEDPLLMNLSMEHGAISQDGTWIAAGSQDSNHLIFDARLDLAGNIGPQGSYPHYALFSSDTSVVAFNSCHFYNGVTVAVPLNLLPGLTTEAYEEDRRTPVIEDQARVYAGVSRGDEFIMGDAYGYVRAVSASGEYRWQIFIGSSIGDIDISPDGKTMAVSTFAGFLVLFELDAGEQAPHQIGNSKHREFRRWIFWRNEPKPLIW